MEQGDFRIDDHHFLTDKKATGEHIRSAISDLFWKTDECDVALFYFSGHGRRDHFGHGYLLPHDADHAAPFIKGIRIQELKELFHCCPHPKQTCIMILDCCYSGIATQAEKGQDDTEHIESFRKDLSLDGTGSGRFILASADADKTSREVECQHALGGEKHVHGLFSFHIIEGLRGGPKDEFGRISLGSLVAYLDGAFRGDPKHRPQLNETAASGVHDIFLSTVAGELEARLQERLGKVGQFLDDKNPTGMMAAIRALTELEKQVRERKEIAETFARIERMIAEVKEKDVFGWWMTNSLKIYQETRRNDWYDLLERVLADFELGTIRQLDAAQMYFVGRTIQSILAKEDHQSVVSDIRRLSRPGSKVTHIASADAEKLPPAKAT